MESSRWWTKDTVAVVTGSNKGIGLEIVRKLAKEGLTVVLTARDERRGLEVVQKLKEEKLDVDFYTLDVRSADSISKLALWLEERYQGLDILVNNAAVADYELNCESAKIVMETNYEGVKKLTKALLPLLKASPAGSRIINVSSAIGQLERIKNESLKQEISNLEGLTEEKVDQFIEGYLEDVNANLVEARGWPTQPYPAYSISKVALNAYSRVVAKSLEKRADGQKIYLNCMTPGYVKTDINKNTGILTPAEGADTAVWLALFPPGGPNGQFFYQRRYFKF